MQPRVVVIDFNLSKKLPRRRLHRFKFTWKTDILTLQRTLPSSVPTDWCHKNIMLWHLKRRPKQKMPPTTRMIINIIISIFMPVWINEWTHFKGFFFEFMFQLFWCEKYYCFSGEFAVCFLVYCANRICIIFRCRNHIKLEIIYRF